MDKKQEEIFRLTVKEKDTYKIKNCCSPGDTIYTVSSPFGLLSSELYKNVV